MSEYEKNKQWKGYISKYALNSDGSFGAEQWGSDTKSAAKGFIGRSASRAGSGLPTAEVDSGIPWLS